MKVLVAASGTGGHLFPARHIIESLLEHGVSVQFVGAGRELEEKILASTGVPRVVLKTAGIKNRGVKGFLEFLLLLPGAFLETWKIFREFQPDVVIGVGGYVTFLPVTVAFIRRVPRWIHEAEHKPGLANAVLSFYANRISTASAEVRFPGFAKTVHTGHPVRRELRAVAEESPEITRPKNLLVLGGSQGARALDLVMIELAPFLKERDLAVWHQCREENMEQVQHAYGEYGIEARVMPFVENLAEAYRWCHLILSRAGAGAVSEIAMVRRPTVFVPYPYAQGDHQAANADSLVREGRAVMVREGGDFTHQLRTALEGLLDLEAYRKIVEQGSRELPPDAAELITKGALELTSV